MESKARKIKQALEIKWAMLLAVGGTTLVAFVDGSGVISNGPGRP